MINLALVSGVVRGSGGTGWSEWLGRSGGWDGEVVGLVRVDWVVRVVRVVQPGCFAFRKIYGLQKKREKSSHVVRTRPPCTDIHVKLDRFPPRFHHCLAELEHGKCYLN